MEHAERENPILIKEPLSLLNKVVLVTGSSRGIGKAIAIGAAWAGSNTIITYNSQEDSANGVAAKIHELGGKVLSLQVDVTSRDSVKRMFNRAINVFGRIDVLVNNAGILQQKPFLEITDRDWKSVLDVNLKGTFICSQEIFPLMQKQGSGVIINMTSSGGQLGGALAVHYSASKAGVICLTKSLARIGASYGIRVNCISPGLIDTEMTREEIASNAGTEKIKHIPITRPGTVNEVAAAVMFLASEQSSYITGQTINVNGGLYLG